ncbi:MAG: endonuclease III domain-containing protein [Candidatus Micrarchaeales archaeon]|nr:endonuclease III domain-containing protein [Candidatus Micrarchaeales archaeon]
MPAKADSMRYDIPALYKILLRHFGFRSWWPGETQFEIIAGAILTQQTSWSNVEKAITNLKSHGALDPAKIASMPEERLQKLIRSSGFYRQKAKRLKAVSKHIISSSGSVKAFLSKDKAALRKELLSMDGIGPETADSVLLYAAGKRIFVVDAYTKRIMSRLYGTNPKIGYDELQSHFHAELPKSVSIYKDMHAQLVELGKNYCKTKPECSPCPLKGGCKYYKANIA